MQYVWISDERHVRVWSSTDRFRLNVLAAVVVDSKSFV